jgi:hypothetical protein
MFHRGTLPTMLCLRSQIVISSLEAE